MNENLEKYNAIFCDLFDVDSEELGEDFTSENIESWDSVNHMNLISEIEDQFDISLEGDDLMEFQSYSKGIEILSKYGITL